MRITKNNGFTKVKEELEVFDNRLYLIQTNSYYRQDNQGQEHIDKTIIKYAIIGWSTYYHDSYPDTMTILDSYIDIRLELLEESIIDIDNCQYPSNENYPNCLSYRHIHLDLKDIALLFNRQL